MPYVGRTPSAVPVTADDIPPNSIDASKIKDGVIERADISVELQEDIDDNELLALAGL